MLRSSSNRSLESVAEERDEVPPQLAHLTPTRTSARSSQTQQHSRQHSRIHERNLSAFFPRPGQQTQGYGGTYDDPHASSPFTPRVTDLPDSTTSTPPPSRNNGATSPSASKAAGRRGHHHRHSVSHNLFPFLDPSSTASPTSSITSAVKSFSSPAHSHPPADAQLPTVDSTFRQRYGHLPLSLQLIIYALTRLSLRSQLALLVSLAQLALGSTLWIQGQAGESLSVTGLGYLVVFDGLGALSDVVVGNDGEGIGGWKREMGKGGDTRIRKPYGSTRLSTLSHFSQAIYLLFSAVYVCKESIEHVLLLHGPEEADGAHGAGHGGVGHGEGRTGGGHAAAAIHFPSTILISASLLALFSALVFSTHSELARSIRSSTPRSSSPSTPSSLRNKETTGRIPVFERLFNPFTMTIVIFGMGLFGAATVLPSAQLSPLDKILSLLISLSMFYIAYPAAVSTGSVLLQTAPDVESKEAKGVRQALNDLENHPSVLEVQSPHVWQLTSSPSTTSSKPLSPSKSFDLFPQQQPSTIMTLTLIVKSDTDEKGILEIVQWAGDRCRNAGIGLGGQPAAKGRREVTIEVKRQK